MTPRWTPAELAVLRPTLPGRRYHRLLPGRTPCAIRAQRSVLIQRGLATARFYRRASMVSEVQRLIQEGLTVAQVASQIRRSPGAVYHYVQALGGIDAARDGFVFTQLGIVALMGVSHPRVRRWVRRGYLVPLPRLPGTGRHVGDFHISSAALQTFLEDRRFWMLWEPETITEPDWRAWASWIRRRAGGRWVSLVEASRHLAYSRQMVRSWLVEGCCRDTRRITATGISGVLIWRHLCRR